MSKRCSYEELLHRYKNLSARCRYWRHRTREIERMRRYRMRTKLVVEAGVRADVSEDVEVAGDELNDVFE